MKNQRKYAIAVGIAIVMTALCVILSALSHPKFYSWQEAADAVSVKDSATITASDATLAADGSVTMTGGDPQLIFKDISEPIAAVYIKTDATEDDQLFGQLFYAADGEGYSERHSLYAYDNGDGELYFELTPGIYDSLRLDIDCNYTLKDVRVSQQPPIKTAASAFSTINWIQAVFILLVMLLQSLLVAWKLDTIVSYMIGIGQYLRENRRQVLIQIGFVAGFGVLGLMGWCLLCAVHVLSWSGYTAFYFLMGGCAVGALVGLWKRKGSHPERTFLVVTLCIGFSYIALMPKTTYVSLDDESHYAAALRLSYFGETYYTQADQSLIGMRYAPAWGNEMAKDTANELNTLYRMGAIEQRSGGYLKYSRLSYLPSAACMWLARAIHLPFTAIFTAGRIGNLLCYAIVLYFAYRRLKNGGLLIGIFALLPMMIFAASNYSYDGFCLSFMALGTAIFLDEYRHPERPLTWWSAGEILLCLVLGCSVRAIFFPIFLMCLFMPKEKFDTARKKRIYQIAVILITLLVLLSFVLPMLFVDGSYNDTRGGFDVNSSLQLAGMLANPIGYLVLLLRFLFTTYFTMDFMVTFAVNYQAYLPATSFGLTFVALLAVAYLYKPGRRDLTLRKTTPAVKIAAVVSFFCSVCLAATAMYMAYTPVGLDTVNGCQARYMMPVLLPMLLQIQPQLGWETDDTRSDYFSPAMLTVTTALIFYGQLTLARGYAGL